MSSLGGAWISGKRSFRIATASIVSSTESVVWESQTKFLPGVGWIGLAIALSLDLAAAGIQGYYGDTVGAAISVLLSLVPFIGSLKSIAKYPQSVYNSLAKKFANATNEDEVIRIFAGLDDPLERKAMSDLLTNPGTIESAQWQYKLAQEVNSTSKNEVLKFSEKYPSLTILLSLL